MIHAVKPGKHLSDRRGIGNIGRDRPYLTQNLLGLRQSVR
jgi:hypothetical protein